MLFTEQIDDILVERAVRRLGILTHYVRMQIIDLLFERKGMTVSDIYETLHILQPEASQHLTLLKEYGFIRKERINNKNYYFVNEAEFNKVMRLVDEVVKEFDED
jgi:DNA-binding transcriptional ArsR family regulator